MDYNKYLKYIPYSSSYISTLPQSVSSSPQLLYNNLLENPISLYFDQTKFHSKINLDGISDTSIPMTYIKQEFLFCELAGYSNIAMPSYKGDAKLEDQCEEISELQENKFLQGEEKEGSKVEKYCFKLQFNYGKGIIYGFEYKEFDPADKRILNEKNKGILIDSEKKENDNKNEIKLKCLIGPDFKIRRGIMYLSKNNFKILMPV